MASPPDSTPRDQLIEDIKSLTTDLEAALDTEIAAGRGRLADLIGELRDRLSELDETTEPEPAQTTVEKLQVRLDELADEIDAEVEEGRSRVMTLVADIEDRLSRLEHRLRPE